MQMILASTIKNTHYLSFDRLMPEEAHKLMDCLFAEDMNERLQWYDIDLGYSVTGYRTTENENKRWSQELALFIESPDDGHGGELIVKELLELAKLILQRTGLKCEED